MCRCHSCSRGFNLRAYIHKRTAKSRIVAFMSIEIIYSFVTGKSNIDSDAVISLDRGKRSIGFSNSQVFT